MRGPQTLMNGPVLLPLLCSVWVKSMEALSCHPHTPLTYPGQVSPGLSAKNPLDYSVIQLSIAQSAKWGPRHLLEPTPWARCKYGVKCVDTPGQCQRAHR